jgi:putative copper resistance protein D
VENVLAAIRFVHFAAAMLVFGTAFFLLAFAPRELRRAFSPPARRCTQAAALVGFVSALAWLTLESAAMSGDWSAAYDAEGIETVLTSTSFGAVWQVRIAVGAVTIVALFFTRADNWGLSTLLAGLFLGSLGLVDHGAMQSGGVGVVHRANDALHLLMTGGWIGGLPLFVICLKAAVAPGHRRDAGLAMLRYSAVGQFAVVTILITGAINIYLTSHVLPWPPISPYRALLMVKIGVVFVMIALALVNRFALLPTIDDRPERAQALRLFAVLELGLGLAAIALVSVFGLLEPV